MHVIKTKIKLGCVLFCVGEAKISISISSNTTLKIHVLFVSQVVSEPGVPHTGMEGAAADGCVEDARSWGGFESQAQALCRECAIGAFFKLERMLSSCLTI